ncbi:c-type cytochrome [Larsenimonas salina]|uniref:c-type cytochrome n=1 Tax=Larsenimonas salina TaxID=1295565 RepID=UPI0020734AF6|nr:cytochrome c [Larsenimonas salina]MCM5704440.1 cytochrome c [Larsenimonas salina]
MKKRTVVLMATLSLFAVQASASAGASSDPDTLARGAYLARAGDCVACHTAPDGKPFAGGLAIESPFGTIYSTNITPDTHAGIGGYTEQEFAAALRQGKRADGANLYPAMPYPSYARLTDEDVHALYVYFMHGVEPVEHQPEQTDLSFPFDQRWGITAWNWLFVDQSTFTPTPSSDAEVNRGRYLVQGLGHCGSCHTPRGLFQQEKALNEEDGSEYLSGANLNGWWAPSLRGQPADEEGAKVSGLAGWSRDDIAEYLATGRNAHSAVGGEMTSVIANSTSHLSEQDLTAIAAYLKTLPAEGSTRGNDSDATGVAKESSTEQTLTRATGLDAGARLYLDNCNACHFASGTGAPRVFPSLVGNSLVNAENPTGLIHTILAGAQLPSTPKNPERLMMPGFAWRLSNQEVAALATFVRAGWGNTGGAVSAEQVKDVRETLNEQPGYSGAPTRYGAKTSAEHATDNQTPSPSKD